MDNVPAKREKKEMKEAFAIPLAECLKRERMEYVDVSMDITRGC